MGMFEDKRNLPDAVDLAPILSGDDRTMITVDLADGTRPQRDSAAADGHPRNTLERLESLVGEAGCELPDVDARRLPPGGTARLQLERLADSPAHGEQRFRYATRAKSRGAGSRHPLPEQTVGRDASRADACRSMWECRGGKMTEQGQVPIATAPPMDGEQARAWLSEHGR